MAQNHVNNEAYALNHWFSVLYILHSLLELKLLIAFEPSAESCSGQCIEKVPVELGRHRTA